MATLTGRTLGGYLILEELGRGAMGVVFKARQLSMDRDVALKFLPNSLAKDERVVARFLREARAAGQLSHPNIVGVHDAGVIDGLHFIAMEFVNGNSVYKRMQKNGPYSEKEALDIAAQIAEALKMAHGRGILHRDIKPDNFLIDSEGRVRLADLGLARFQNDAKNEANLTQDGSTLGTPNYMAPEQCAGNTLDARSDLYSLGASIYVMASGQNPYEANTAAAIMVKAMTEPPRPLKEMNPQLSPGFVAMVEKMMAKEAARRFQDAQQVLAAIEKCKAGTYRFNAVQSRVPKTATVKSNTPNPLHSVSTPPDPAFAAGAESSKLKPLLLGAAAGIVVLILLGIVFKSKASPATDPNQVKGPTLIAATPEKAAKTDGQTTAVPVETAVKTDKSDKNAPPEFTIPPPNTEARKKHEAVMQKLLALKQELYPQLRQNPVLVRDRIEDFLKERPLGFRRWPPVSEFLKEIDEAVVNLAKESFATKISVRRELADGNTAQAVDLFLKFEKTYPGTAEAAFAHKEVYGIIAGLQSEAKAAADAGKFDDALKMLNRAIEKLPAELGDPLKKDVAAVQAQQQAAQIQADENKRLDGLNEKAVALAKDADTGGRRYRFEEAAKVYRDGLDTLKTEQGKASAQSSADVYARAAAVMERMRTLVNEKKSVTIELFKTPARLLEWDEHGLTFEDEDPLHKGQPPQAAAWNHVTPDNLLEIAHELKIGANKDAPSEQLDLNALSFAVGAAKIKPGADVATHATKAVEPVKPEGDREGAARQVFNSAKDAREKKDMGLMSQHLVKLMSEYSNTDFVQAHAKEINELGLPPVVETPKAAVIKDAEKDKDKESKEDATVADLKKLGWEEIKGLWSEPQKGNFQVKNGGELGLRTSDAATQVTFQLDNGASIGVYVRYEPDNEINKMKRTRIEKLLGLDVGRGYGFQTEGNSITAFGAKVLSGIGKRAESRNVPLKVNNVTFDTGSHSLHVSVHGDKLELELDDHPKITTELSLRPDGQVRIVIEGAAKLNNPQVTK